MHNPRPYPIDPEIERATQEINYAIVSGALSGAYSGAMGLANAIIHPLDNVIYPILDLCYDAAVITAGHIDPTAPNPLQGDLIFLHQAISRNPQLYHDAKQRMQQRVVAMKASMNNFQEATPLQKVEAISHSVTSFFVPGTILKGIKVLPQISTNLINYRTPFNPPAFHNISSIRTDPLPSSFRNLTISDIRQMSGEKGLMYVITQDKKLIISHREYPKSQVLQGFGTAYIHHPELALLKPVLAAGELTVLDRKLSNLNNMSGHYLPNGHHLEKLVTTTFIKNGFVEARGKYTDISKMIIQPSLQPKISAVVTRENINFKPSFLDHVKANLLTVNLNFTKTQQQDQARFNLTKERARDLSANSFAPNANVLTPTLTSMWNSVFQPRPYSFLAPSSQLFLSPHFSRYMSGYSNNNLSFSNYWRVKDAVCSALQSEMRSSIPSILSAYARAQLYLGFGYSLSLSEFRSVVASSNLISTYNSFNPNSRLRDVANFCREIGGVANDVSIITDMINSEAHAAANEYIFCFPSDKFPVSDNLIKQIQRESAQGYFKHKTTGIFSLHINNKGFSYPVLHPAFQNTHAGQIMGLLDYTLKGYLNGGVFDGKFLKDWHLTENCDESYLKSKLIDLKKYCKENVKDMDYFSLREMLSRYGLKENMGNTECAFKQPFMTSFRIIAYQEKIERHGNILILHPAFRVEYSIDLMPDYKKYLDEYYEEHGCYPPDYQQIKHCYELFAEEVKEKLPKLPFCRNLVHLLGLMNAFSYFNATAEQMGKIPVFEEEVFTQIDSFPKSIPPIPVRYYRTYPIKIAFEEVLKDCLVDSQLFDNVLLSLFSQAFVQKLPEALVKKINDLILSKVREKLTPHFPPDATIEMHEEEIERITKDASRILLQNIGQTHREIHQIANKMLREISPSLEEKNKSLSIPDKIRQTQSELTTHLNTVISKWEENPSLAQAEIFDQAPKNLHKKIEEIFDKVKNQIQNELQDVIQQKQKEGLEHIQAETQKIKSQYADLLQKRIENLSKQEQEVTAKDIAEMERVINENLVNEIQAATNKIAELQKIINQINQQIPLRRNSITQLTNHKAEQIAKIPVNLRAINQANINAFSEKIDQDIASINGVITELLTAINQINGEIGIISAAIVAGKDKVTKDIAANKIAITKEIHDQVIDKTNQIKNNLAEAERADINQLTQGQNELTQTLIANLTLDSQKITNVALKDEAIRVLTILIKEKQEKLKKFYDDTSHFSNFIQLLLNVPDICALVVCEQYTHALMTFTNHDLVQLTGDRFQIVGGCGMSLPNIESKPIQFAEQFAEIVSRSCPDKAETVGQFSFNGVGYKVFKVAVADAALANENNLESSEQEEALSTLEYLAAEEGELELPSLEVIKTAIDSSGATLAHYASAMLENAKFTKLVSVLPDQINVSDHLGNLPIHVAAMSGNVSVINNLGLQCAQREAKNKRAATPLIIAAQYGQKEVVEALLAQGVNVNHQLPNGLFPLYIAIQNNFEDIALLLIDKGLNLEINQMLDSYMTPLHIAIENQMQATALALLEKGAKGDIKRKSDGFSPLHLAAHMGQLTILKAIIAKGISINLALESQKTILHLAAEAGHLDIINYLISQSMDVDAQTVAGETALMLAIKAGHTQVARALAKVAKVDVTNRYKQTASLLAVQYGMSIVADDLIARGENLELRDREGYNVVFYLSRSGEYKRFVSLAEQDKFDIEQKFAEENLTNIAARFGQFLIVYDLLDRKVKFNKSADDLDLIHYAVIADEIDYMSEWVEEFDVEEINKAISSGIHKGKSMGYLAAEHSSHRCLEFLMDNGYLSEKDIQNQKLLTASIESRHPKTVSMILNRWGNVNDLLDTQGNTALHRAVRLGSLDVAQLLLSRGADITLRNHKGYTPFHLAFLQKDTYLLKRLFKLSAPSDWPHDLWDLEKQSKQIDLILTKNKKRLPAQVTAPTLERKNDAVQAIPPTSATANALNVTEKLIKKIHTLLNLEAFQAVIELANKNPAVLEAFKSPKGGKLFQAIFANTYDYSALMVSLRSKSEDFDPESFSFASPDSLLALLKKSGINPASFVGKDNVILTMIAAKTDEEACYRFNLFANHFPDALITLVKDNVTPKITIANLALKRKKTKLFEKMDEIIWQQSNTEIVAFSGLHDAVQDSNYELVKKLLNRYPVNQVNDQGQTPLMLAALFGNVHMIELLLRHGAKVDGLDIQGQNALHYAIQGKSEIAALRLLPLLVKQNQPDRQGITPLMLAAKEGQLPVVRYLCEATNYTASFDRYGRNALHYASLAGQVDSIQALVNAGFDIHQVESPSSTSKIKKSRKRSALHLAAQFGHVEAAQKLLALKANPEQRDSIGNTFTDYGIMSKDASMLHFIQRLPFYHDRATNAQLLRTATLANHTEVLNELVLEDISFNSVNEIGQNALHLAAISDAGDAADILVQREELILDLPDVSGDTPLHEAARYGHVRVLEVLIKAGAQINSKNKNSETALYLACEQGQFGAVVALLKYRADSSIPNANSMLPYQIAFKNNHHKIANILTSIGNSQELSEQKMSSVLQQYGIYQKQREMTKSQFEQTSSSTNKMARDKR